MSTSRRIFLKILGAFPLTAALSRHTEASTSASVPLPPPMSPPARRLLLNRFSIAGFQYYDGPALVHRLGPREKMAYKIDHGCDDVEEFVYRGVKSITSHKLHPGCPLDLKAEPANPHDPFAVEIRLGKIKLGYVPRSDNKHISRLLDQGANLNCRVIEIDHEAGVWNMVRVEVAMMG